MLDETGSDLRSSSNSHTFGPFRVTYEKMGENSKEHRSQTIMQAAEYMAGCKPKPPGRHVSSDPLIGLQRAI